MPETLLAIDPGPERSAWLEYDGGPVRFGIDSNHDVLWHLRLTQAERLAIESVASYGMAVGAEVFETCVWTGRFIQSWVDLYRERGSGGTLVAERSIRRLYRRDVKMHLCGSNAAKDANVRQALIDRYGPGREAAVGRKAAPGPLYGVSKDVWAALAVAVTATETER